MKLMIVESPNKIEHIEPELGSDWKVMASVGHVRDMPVATERHSGIPSLDAIGIDSSDFSLSYEYIPAKTVNGRTFPGGEQRVAKIRSQAREADAIYLATDDDREGEAISWHLKESLGLRDGQFQRVTFNEITGSVIRAAINNARGIDYDLVHAQEARRALDRMVGYMVSPILSDALGMTLSAGRVQSVAARLVVDLERRIKAFKSTKHYGAVVSFDSGAWKAAWVTKPFVTEDVPYVLDAELAKRAAACRSFRVLESGSTVETEAPPKPFSTSLLLRAASTALRYDPEVTAKLAQRLFEKGVITYIRTDSVNLGAEPIAEIRAFAESKGLPLPDKPRRFKEKGNAQGAHEAIRPTHIEVETAGDTEQERALYRLIWQRAVASQLADARYRATTVLLEATDGDKPYQFKAKGRVLIEKGWRALTAEDATDEGGNEEADDAGGRVPVLDVGAAKAADDGAVVTKQTQPPKRFSKSSLIEKLEAEGIGRPATYPQIMSTIMTRGYVSEKERLLYPTELGELVVDTLVKAGFAFMEVAFTREVEEQFDAIAEGKIAYREVVEPAYHQLRAELERIASSGEFKPRYTCPKCSGGLHRYVHATRGAYWHCRNKACGHYMDDRDGKPVEREVHPCPKCQTALRRFKRKSGAGFVWVCPKEGCETFCDDVNGKPLTKEHHCPKCKAPLRRFQRKDKETGKPKGHAWFCTNEACKTFLDDDKGKPVAVKVEPCPECGRPMYRRKGEHGYWWGCSGYKDGCKHTMDDRHGKPVPRGTAGKPAGGGGGAKAPRKSPGKPPRR
jgi:DNA topoisomerase-1